MNSRLLSGLLAIVLGCFASQVRGEDRTLSGAEITATLSGKMTESADPEKKTTQSYYKNGETIYMADGSPSQGSWQVRGNQYCSQWPPNEAWVCYDFVQNGDIFSFVASSGKRYPIRIVGPIAP